MKKHFYLMRHGETLFNVRKKIQGWCDSPLTENGIKQAQTTADFFDTLNLTHLYSSTSERCCDTLEIATRNRMPYTRLKGLREMHFGRFEGESEELHPSMEAREAHYLQFGGESRSQVRERLVETCIHIMEQPDHDCVLAVSHAGACKQFLSQWQDPTEERAKGFPNCCIFHYHYEDRRFELVEVLRLC
jgi:broad specificity phosphatase PhoE